MNKFDEITSELNNNVIKFIDSFEVFSETETVNKDFVNEMNDYIDDLEKVVDRIRSMQAELINV